MSSISIENKQKLSDLYYNNNFFGRDKLYQLALSNDINITRVQAMEFLKSQEIYQRYKQPKKAKVIKPTILKSPLKQLGIDLIDMQNKEYNKFRYILTCIDLFSKKAWTQAIKTKSDIDVVNAMQQIIIEINNPISSIRSDRGPEFTNEKMIKLFDKYNIKQVLSLPYKPQSNGNVERFNGVLKRLINASLKFHDSYDWVSILPQLTENYNNTKHSRIKKVPNDINENDYKEIHDNIQKSVLPNNEIIKFLEIGDRIRIKESNEKDGSYWSKKIYKISKVFKPRKSVSNHHYLIDGFEKHFYENDVQKIDNVENEFDETEKYEISKIVSPSFKNGEPSFVVKWKGYKELTTERREKLIEDVPKLIKQFEKDHNVVWKKQSFSWN